MGSKSRLLERIAPSLSSAHVPELIAIAVDEWRRGHRDVLAALTARFHQTNVAVRSDAASEDGHADSQAGRFLSLLDVPCAGLEAAIERVMASLPGDAGDAVIVQRMAGPSMAVCVGSTHRIFDGAPWYCLDIAPSSGPAVTNGRTQVRHVALSRSEFAQLESIVSLDECDRIFFEIVREVETFYGGVPIEIEAAIDRDAKGNLSAHLLQVRMLSDAAKRSWRTTAPECRLPSLDFLDRPDDVAAIAGRRTVLSLMADWNPAELIGTHPRPLALSLYRALIGDGAWWSGRSALGYAARPSWSIELLRVMHGRPLVDVRRSANSMLPAGLSQLTASRIVDCWIDRLAARPALHDKVEFSVFRTVRDFAPARAADRDEYRIDQRGWREWNAALDELSRKVTAADASAPLSALRARVERFAGSFDGRASWDALLGSAQEIATSFSSVARLAFIGDAQLRSAVERDAIAPERAFELRAAASIRAIHAIDRPSGEDESVGHLRPGTFEVTTKASSELGPVGEPNHTTTSGRVPSLQSLSGAEKRRIDLLLAEAGYLIDAGHWLRFVTHSLRARERSKFVLSRCVSAILDHALAAASRRGVDREAMSWLTANQVAEGMRRDSTSGTGPTSARWREQAEAARQQHDWEATLMISPILIADSDRLIAISSGVLPNFVGRSIGEGRVVVLTDPNAGRELDVTQSIVVTQRADPGYDWLFRRNIAGLITAWGGANSHLGIRCAEFALPAAIGCGEAFVTRAMLASHARIDPLSGGVWLRGQR